MKIVLSRKGFDASAGGVASPILPDGTMLSLPIPDPASLITYDELTLHGHSLGKIVTDLTRNRIMAHEYAHLDPDLDSNTYSRREGWRPLFGQDGAALGHLRNQGIQPGDLFLFFGWFRWVQMNRGRYEYIKDAPDLHVIYGWLQVETSFSGKLLRDEPPAWMSYHPHCRRRKSDRNQIFVGTEILKLGKARPFVSGAGLIRRFRQNLQLTRPSARSRSRWQVPSWLYPSEGKPPLTYHTDLSRWSKNNHQARLQSASRGQEFILDTRYYPEAIDWALGLIMDAHRRT